MYIIHNSHIIIYVFILINMYKKKKKFPRCINESIPDSAKKIAYHINRSCSFTCSCESLLFEEELDERYIIHQKTFLILYLLPP